MRLYHVYTFIAQDNSPLFPQTIAPSLSHPTKPFSSTSSSLAQLSDLQRLSVSASPSYSPANQTPHYYAEKPLLQGRSTVALPSMSQYAVEADHAGLGAAPCWQLFGRLARAVPRNSSNVGLLTEDIGNAGNSACAYPWTPETAN